MLLSPLDYYVGLVPNVYFHCVFFPLWYLKHLRTRSTTVRHWRDISLSAYEQDFLTNEKVWFQNTSGFSPFLGRWRLILWRFSTILHFGATDQNLPVFLLYMRSFLRCIFEANEKFGNFGPWKVTWVSWKTPLLLLQPKSRISVENW